MVGAPYFHSVRLQTDKCKGCTNCIKGCPTEAIQLGAERLILEGRCIDCGECIGSVPTSKVAIDKWGYSR